MVLPLDTKYIGWFIRITEAESKVLGLAGIMGGDIIPRGDFSGESIVLAGGRS